MNRSDIHAGFVLPRLLPRLSFCQDLPRLSPKTLAVGFVLPKSLTTNEAVAKRQRKIGPCLSASGQGSPSFLFSPSCRGNGAPTRRWPGSPGQRHTTSVRQGDFTVKTISLRENKYAARANSWSRLIQVGKANLRKRTLSLRLRAIACSHSKMAALEQVIDFAASVVAATAMLIEVRFLLNSQFATSVEPALPRLRFGVPLR